MSGHDTSEAKPRTLATDGAPGGVEVEVGLALTVAWCRDAPERTAELLLVPPGDRRVHVFGRGDDAPADLSHHRLQLQRQRPGVDLPTAPLQARRLSREQIYLQRKDGDRLALENRGRLALLVRGVETVHAIVRAGDVIDIEGELVLQCVERAPNIPQLKHISDVAMHAFGTPDAHGLIGESPALWALRDALAAAATAPGHVLIHGPTGADKAPAAHALHAASARCAEPLVVRDVAQIPAELFGLELFGQDGPTEEGTPGFVEQADGGTLLLHGLGALAAPLASRLGRFMAGADYHRAGDPRPRQADVRVIATLDGLPESLPAGLRTAFTHVIAAPPLSARPEDVPLVALALLRGALTDHPDLRARFADARGEPRLAPGFVRALLEHPEDRGARALETHLWHGLVTSPGDWVIAPPGLAQKLAADTPPPVDLPGGPLEPAQPSSAVTAARAPATLPAQPRPPAAFVAPAPPAPASPATPPGDPRLLPTGLPQRVLAGLPTLSATERLVLQHLACDRTSAEIGRRLAISVRAVHNQRTHLGEKLGLLTPNSLLGVALALERYLGRPDEEPDTTEASQD